MTVKFGSTGLWATNTPAANTVETYSALAGLTPVWRFAETGPLITSVNTTYAAFYSGYHFGNFIGTAPDQAFIYTSRVDNNNDDNGTWINESINGLNWLQLVSNFSEYVNVYSAGPGQIYYGGGNNDPDNHPYHSLVLAGSVDAQVSDQLVTFANVGSQYTLTTSFEPDFMIAFAILGNAGNEYAPYNYHAMSIIDYKHKRFQSLTACAKAGGAPYRSQFTHSRSHLFPLTTSSAQYDYTCSAVSYGATGFTFEVDSRVSDFGDDTNTIIGYTAVKFPAGYGHSLGQDVLGTSNATRSFQTNSLYPLALLAFMTMASSEDCLVSSGVTSASAYSAGIWTKSEGHGWAFGYTQYPEVDRENSRTGSLGFVACVGSYQTSDPLFYVQTVTPYSGGFNANAVVSTDYANPRFSFLAMGDAIDAPAHLMDANSVSIFLAANSDYHDNLLLVTPPATPPAGLSTSVVRAHVEASAGTWVESHPALGDGTPGFRMGFIHETNGYGTVLNVYRGGATISVLSTGNNYYSDQHVISEFLGGSTRDTRFQSSSFDTAGGGLARKVNGGIGWIEQLSYSAGPNAFVFVDDASGLNNWTQSTPYIVSEWNISSLQVETTLTDTIHSSSIGHLSTASTILTSPDIAFVMGALSEPTLPNDSTVAYCQNVIGFVDCNHINPRFIHEGATTANGGFYGISTSKNVVGAGENGDRTAFAVTSMAAHGLVFEVLSRDTTAAGGMVFDTHALAITYVKLPADTYVHVGHIVTSLGTHTFSRQTNSLYPTWAYFMGTNCQSYDEPIPGANGSVDLACFGFWSNSGIAGGIGGSFFLETQYIDSLDTRILTAWPNSATGIDYYSESLSPGSGAFSMSFVTSQGHGRNIVNYLMIGEAINAEAHLQDASGASIFLADLDDYPDNLMLSGQEVTSSGPPPSSSGPAAGGALFRSEPITDNREFPTPLTNVRAFPSD